MMLDEDQVKSLKCDYQEAPFGCFMVQLPAIELPPVRRVSRPNQGKLNEWVI